MPTTKLNVILLHLLKFELLNKKGKLENQLKKDLWEYKVKSDGGQLFSNNIK